MFGANPNTMTFKQVFSAEYQMSHFRQPVYQILADTRFDAGLTKGQTLNRSFASDVQVNDMGADGSYSTQAITDTQESLTVNFEKEASIYIKSLDQMQAHLPVKQKYAKKLANALINQIDGDVLLRAFQGAGTIIDNSTLGGSVGDGIVASASNVSVIFSLAMEKLIKKNVVYNNARFSGLQAEVPEGMPIAVIPPEILTFIQLFIGGKDTRDADDVNDNGFHGDWQGFQLFVSNSLTWTGTLGLATQPTDGDTVTINGVVFTFKTALGAVAGQVLIGASAATANTNLTALVNAPSVTTAQGVALTSANQRLLKNITATAAATSTTFVSAGWGNVVVSRILTAAADVFTLAKQQVHAIFGLSKSVALVVQKDPSLEENFVSGKIGKDFIAWAVYGIKVFADQAPMIVDVALQVDTYSATSNLPK